MILLLFFPIWEKFDPQTIQRVSLDAFSMEHTEAQPVNGEQTMVSVQSVSTWYIAALAILAAIIAVYEIFKYDNRLTQMKLGALNSLIMAGSLVLSIVFVFQGVEFFATDIQGQYQFGLMLPTIALFFNLLANRFIRRDENLVRSADRIR
jgi:hypothetical protein